MNDQKQNEDNETIEIKELWQILVKYKVVLWSTTLTITFIAVLYAFFTKPVYEATSVVELASIKDRPVHNINDVKQKLSYTFIDTIKNMKTPPKTYIKSISIPKKTTNLLVIKADSIERKLAKNKIQELINSLINTQEENINTYIILQEKNIKLLENDINVTTNSIQAIVKKNMEYDKRLFSIEKDNPALAGIYAIELSKMQSDLNSLRKRLSKLSTDRNNLIFSISDNVIKHTKIIGKIETANFAIKPKKKLIVIVSFITGLIFSMILVFLINFIQGTKEEKGQ